MLDLVGSRLSTFGNVYVVNSSADSADPSYNNLANTVITDTDGQVRLFNSLETVYGLMNSNDNDVCLLDAHSTHNLPSGMLTVAKNRVHFFGMDGGRRLVQQGAKIQVTGALDTPGVIKVTGNRCSFENIKFIQGSSHANALNVIQAAGEGTVYKNCSAIFGVADNLDLTTSSELLLGEDSGTFIDCSFGTDVLLTTGARAVITLDAISGAASADGAKSNRFYGCEALIMSSSASALLVKLADTAGAKFMNKFVDMDLMAVISSGGGGIALTNAIASAAGFVDGSLNFVRPSTSGCTNGCATVTDHVVVTAPLASNNAWEGVTPA